VQAVDLAQSTTIREPVALAPTSPSPSPSPSASSARRTAASAERARPTRSGARQEASPTPAPSLPPSMSPSGGVAAADFVNRHNESTADGVIRVTSAGFDLTGQPELALVGDDGWLVGQARCTKTVRNDPGARPRVVPSTLVCWRVSEDRSVVTVAVAPRGKPSSGQSVAVLEREWARLG
jgi:hypothetical protein